MTHAKIPVHLDLDFRSPTKATLINGKERIRLTPLPMNGETYRFEWPLQALSIEFKIIDKKIVGEFIRHHKTPIQRYRLSGEWGKRDLFPQSMKKSQLIKKAYRLELGEEKTSSLLTIQTYGKKFTANIQTPTGDYRFISGIVDGSNLVGASFDGVYNYLFLASISGNKIAGSLLNQSQTLFTGEETFETSLNQQSDQLSSEKLSFSFSSVDGKKVSLDDKAYLNKPVIIQFFGSWCPNCIDETQFLIPWFKQNQKRGIEIIAISYERAPSENEGKLLLKKVLKKLKPNYPILVGSLNSSESPKDHFPSLTQFHAFPTTLFLDRNHRVIYQHSGFSGPAAGEAFTLWKTKFAELTDRLIGDKK